MSAEFDTNGRQSHQEIGFQESRLYVGRVMHERRIPKRNQFAYGVYYLYLDIDRLDEIDSSLARFGHNRRALMSLWDVDHGPRDGSPLRLWIDGLLATAGIDLAGGQVFLLTFPRVFGFRFFPVSFWYCFHSDGTPRAVLAEVQNTFRDRHNYLLHSDGGVFDWNDTPQATKAFYVSPFIQLEDVTHEFHFTEPGDKLAVSIFDHVAGPLVLTAAVSLSAQPLTDAGLVRVVRRLGPMSARALVLIHWQAVKLFAKRVRFYSHTPPPKEETSL